MASGHKVFTPSILTAADVNDYLMKQSVMVFASTAARDSALAAVLAEGMYVYITGEDRYYSYTGSAWVRVGWSTGGRTGCALARAANQSIANSTQTPISWDTELLDSDGYIAVTAASVVIPAGQGGIYAITGRVALASAADHFISLSAGTRSYDDSARTAITTNPSVSVTVPLAVSDAISLSVFQLSGGAMNVTASLDVYRVGA